jgi:hypothetical protein
MAATAATPDHLYHPIRALAGTFNGTARGVQLAIADAAERAGQLVTPEDAVRVALARQ